MQRHDLPCELRGRRAGTRPAPLEVAPQETGSHNNDALMTTYRPLARRGVTRALMLLGSVFVLSIDGASAQTLTTGALAGRVVDEGGVPLSNVLVTLEDPAVGERRTVPADRSGRFRIVALAPTEYVLTVERIGFLPARIDAVRIEPERELFLEIWLTPSAAAPTRTERRRAGRAIGPAGAVQWIPPAALEELGGRSRTFGEAVRLTTIFASDGSAEGLPPWLSAGAVDGAWYRPASLSPMDRSVSALPFSVSGFETSRALRNPLDVEWSGTAGAVLSGASVRGAVEPRGEVSARWSGSAISPTGLDGGDPSFSDLQGTGVIRAGAADGALRLAAGVDARRQEVPLSAAWAGRIVPEPLVDGEEGVVQYSRAGLRTTTALAGFGRFDWNLSDDQGLVVSLHAAGQPSLDMVHASGAITEQDARDLLAGGRLSSRLGAATVNELRVSFGAGERVVVADSGALPLTLLAGAGLGFGARREWASVRDARLHVSEALHFRAGRHAFKIGGDAVLGAYRYVRPSGGWSEYRFGGADAFVTGTGVVVSSEIESSSAEWTDRTFGLFAQDRFAMGDQVEVMAGLRIDRQTLPDSPSLDEEWQRLTGIESNVADEPGVRISPRASIAWQTGGARPWVLSAEGGIFYDRLDPHALAQWLTDDGSISVRYLSGALSWPIVPESGGEVFPRLTLLGSNFDVPRTLRLTAGVAAPDIAGANVVLSGTLRRTDNLPRRDDVNLAPAPPLRDQHGRVIYGTLLKQDALVYPEAGSNRRFSTYDDVTALVSDATSLYWGLSLDLERNFAGGLGGVVRYTYSRATDNWFGAQYDGWTISAPRELRDDEEWLETTSDFDVPHRLTAALIWDPAPARIAAVYRFQSGRPFTPGFQPGVDVNGDGVPGNDPAFVDENIAGTEVLLQRWSCLAAAAFARRNACRGAGSHALDVSASIAFLHFGRASVAAHAEAFGLLGSGHARVDDALYLIDPAADLINDPAAQTVTVPLIANDNFGRELKGSLPGRVIRLGLSIEW